MNTTNHQLTVKQLQNSIILFVHLGEHIDDLMKKNIEQTLFLNPSTFRYLVTLCIDGK